LILFQRGLGILGIGFTNEAERGSQKNDRSNNACAKLDWAQKDE